MMKLKLAALFVLCTLASVVAAQPRPLLFDSLTIDAQADGVGNELTGRIARFEAELKRRPSAKPVLIHYRARVRDNNHSRRASGWAHTAQISLSQKNGKYIEGMVVSIDGGVREEETLEFWLIPRGADLPVPTPEYSREHTVDCPDLIAYQEGLNFDKSDRVKLFARVYPESEVDFEWSVSDGRIVESDHRARAVVDVSKVKDSRLFATVRVSGFPALCKDARTVVAEFGNTTKLYDRWGRLSNGDMKARMDAFMNDLSKHSGTHGYFYVYGGRGIGGRDRAGRIRLISQQIVFRNFDRKRLTVIDAGYRNEISTDVWIVPSGQEPPKPTPTTEREFVSR